MATSETGRWGDLAKRVGTQPAQYRTGYQRYKCYRCEEDVTHVVVVRESDGNKMVARNYCHFCLPKRQTIEAAP